MYKSFTQIIYSGKRCLYRPLIFLALPVVCIAATGISTKAADKGLSVMEASTAKADIAVTGKVTDSKGQPLPGVSVRLKGTTTGITTRADGTFSLSLPDDNGVLVFSFIGFVTQEVPVKGKTEINIAMQDSPNSLNEVVVVGYGTQQRKDITGSIASIDEKTLREVPVTNPQQMLEGRIAGVYVTQSDSRPGAQPSVLIRGHRSITASNDPLYVIDGIPTTDGLNDINPNDITSMEVLKDASATAIYGSRGANGVILITTARGKFRADGQPEVHYDTYFGAKDITHYADVLNGPQYVQFVRDAYTATGNYNTATPAASDAKIFNPTEVTAIQNNQYTNWQKLITQTGFTQNHELGILGASKTTRYNMSFGYYDDKGDVKLQDYQRFNLRANLDQDIGTRVKVGLSMLGSYSITDGAGYNPFYGAVIQIPLGTPYAADGTLAPLPAGDALMYNPLSNLIPGNVINKTTSTRVLGSIYAEAKVFDGLKLRVNFGPDLTNARTGNFNASNTTANAGGINTASNSDDYIFSYTLEDLLTYDKTIGKNRINFTGLYSVQQRVEETTSVSVSNLPVATVTDFNLATANLINGVGSGYQKWDILSYMGRLNYGYDERFLLTLTGRSDGSSRLAPGHEWAFFPSVAAAYNISNESFIKSLDYVSNLKLRLSWGRTGNQAVQPYGTQGLLKQTTYTFNNVSAFGYAPSSIANPNLQWETTETYNVGIDFGFLKNRITGTVEGYRSHTYNLLLPFTLPTSSGFATVTTNVGSTRNTGFEAAISTKNIVSANKGGFQWTTDFTTAFDKEEILSLSLGKVDDVADARFIGQALNVYYDYKKVGIWQTGQTAQAVQYSSSVGQIKVADLNGDGKIDANDRTILGQANPKWTYGFNNRFNLMNFDLGIFMVAQTGNLITDYFRTVPNNSIALGGRYNSINVNYWTPNNPSNAYPQPLSGQSGSPGPIYGSTLKYFDGSFLRIRNADLGYNLPSDWVKKIKAQSVRIYFNVTNPYIFSSFVHKYNGIDPENTSQPAFVNYLLGFNIRY